jgi:hypothetical protein
MSYLGGFLGPSSNASGLGGSLGAGTSISGLGGQLGSGTSSLPTPVGWWKINEGSGTSFLNYEAGPAMTEPNPVWASNAGFPGSSNTFGGNTAAAVSYSALYDFSNVQPFSASAWGTVGGAGLEGGLFGNVNDTNGTYQGWDVFYDNSSGRLYFEIFNNISNNFNQVYIAASALGIGTIFHAVFTYDGSGSASGMKVYVNGVAQTVTVASNTLTATSTNGTIPFCIGGRYSTGTVWQGVIADVRLYNSALTQASVTSLYSAGPA